MERQYELIPKLFRPPKPTDQVKKIKPSKRVRSAAFNRLHEFDKQYTLIKHLFIKFYQYDSTLVNILRSKEFYLKEIASDLCIFSGLKPKKQKKKKKNYASLLGRIKLFTKRVADSLISLERLGYRKETFFSIFQKSQFSEQIWELFDKIPGSGYSLTELKKYFTSGENYNRLKNLDLRLLVQMDRKISEKYNNLSFFYYKSLFKNVESKTLSNFLTELQADKNRAKKDKKLKNFNPQKFLYDLLREVTQMEGYGVSINNSFNSDDTNKHIILLAEITRLRKIIAEKSQSELDLKIELFEARDQIRDLKAKLDEKKREVRSISNLEFNALDQFLIDEKYQIRPLAKFKYDTKIQKLVKIEGGEREEISYFEGPEIHQKTTEESLVELFEKERRKYSWKNETEGSEKKFKYWSKDGTRIVRKIRKIKRKPISSNQRTSEFVLMKSTVKTTPKGFQKQQRSTEITPKAHPHAPKIKEKSSKLRLETRPHLSQKLKISESMDINNQSDFKKRQKRGEERVQSKKHSIFWFTETSSEHMNNETLLEFESVFGEVHYYLSPDALYFINEETKNLEKIDHAEFGNNKYSKKFILHKTITTKRDLIFLIATPQLPILRPKKTFVEFCVVGKGIAVINQSLFVILFAGDLKIHEKKRELSAKDKFMILNGWDDTSSFGGEKRTLKQFLSHKEICRSFTTKKPKIEVSLDNPEIFRSRDSLIIEPEIVLKFWFNTFVYVSYFPEFILESIVFVSRDPIISGGLYEKIKVDFWVQYVDHISSWNYHDYMENFRGE